MPKQKIEAEPAYETGHMIARDLLARIDELLHEMPAPGGETRISWAHVGTINHVNSKLSDIVQSLSYT